MTNEATGISCFSAMLRHALGHLLDPAAEGFVDMMAPDGVMEFPYAPPGYATRIEGREVLAGYLAKLGDILVLDRMTDPTVHLTRDPQTVILEFGCEGRGVKTNRPYNQRYISVITVRDGLIVRYKDYWNPLIVLEALGDNSSPNAAAGGRR